jgi:hypothetical protein
MIKKNIGSFIAILAIIGAVLWIYRSLSGDSERFDLTTYNAFGAGTAEETAKLLGNKGQVLVIAPDTSEFKNPAVEGQLSSFQKTLTKKGLTVAAPVRFKVTPMESMALGGAVPRDRFLSALQSHPNTGAVVLFCAFPPLESQDYDALKSGSTKFVVASGYMPAYRNLLNAQVIHLAIVPQFDRSATPAKEAKTLREAFDQEFLVITPANTASLPY